MASLETKDKMGAILFDMLSLAVREIKGQMKFPSWQAVDKETKDAYMRVVDQLLEVSESEPLPAKTVAETPLKIVGSEPVLVKANEGSDLLASILNDTKPPSKLIINAPLTTREKMSVEARMAKARAARGSKKQPVVVTT